MMVGGKCENRVLGAVVDCEAIRGERDCDKVSGRCEWTKGYKWFPGEPKVVRGGKPYCVKRADVDIIFPQSDSPP